MAAQNKDYTFQPSLQLLPYNWVLANGREAEVSCITFLLPVGWNVDVLAGNGEPLCFTTWRNIIQDTRVSDNGVQPILA